MKKLLLSTLGCLLAVSAYSQDKLYTHKGDTLTVHIKELNENHIKFNYPNEESTNTLSKNVIEKIEYESGRIEQITNKIIINGLNDWEKVVVTNLESDVLGLTKIGDFKAKAKGSTMTSQGKVEARAFNKLKKEAAAEGCHILLILTTTGKSGSPYSSASSSLTAVGYKY
ncbi:MAG: hypothetical protein RSF68_01260 [Myroides sp.]